MGNFINRKFICNRSRSKATTTQCEISVFFFSNFSDELVKMIQFSACPATSWNSSNFHTFCFDNVIVMMILSGVCMEFQDSLASFLFQLTHSSGRGMMMMRNEKLLTLLIAHLFMSSTSGS